MSIFVVLWYRGLVVIGDLCLVRLATFIHDCVGSLLLETEVIVIFDSLPLLLQALLPFSNGLRLLLLFKA